MEKIIIIDDDEHNLDVLAWILTDEGYNVLTLLSADEIEVYLEQFRPKLIYLDILLPGKSGIAVCNRLKLDPTFRQIKVVLMSACNRNLKQAKQDNCADGYLSKPYDFKEIIEMAKQFAG